MLEGGGGEVADLATETFERRPRSVDVFGRKPDRGEGPGRRQRFRCSPSEEV